VLFDLINLVLPQPGETAQFSIVSLRYGLASVIVAFPIFLFMCRVIARETQSNPGQRLSPVRRWLTYLTLFVAAVSIVADLITLIVRFLGGDITLRFGLKVVVVAVLAGSAFMYYLRELRREEAALIAEPVSTRFTRIGFGVMIALVLLTLGFGFWFAGSPMRARLLAQDEQRVQDLMQISNSVEQYYVHKEGLPDSLIACDLNPGTFVRQKTDRITGQPYVYRVVDATHFQLGATFALPGDSNKVRMAPASATGTAWRGEADFWAHGAGPVTFTIDATRVNRRGN
jgi:hypothetical protein